MSYNKICDIENFDPIDFMGHALSTGGGGGPSTSASSTRDLVLVIMAFEGDGTADVLSAVKDECAKLHLSARRDDEAAGSGFVIKDIVTLIKEAEFIICDLTHERPNVYYELGYAHGVGNHPFNILLIAKEGTRLHFDVAPLRVQYFKSTEHLREIVASQLARMIELVRSGPGGLTP